MIHHHEPGSAWAERRFQAALVLLGDALNFARDTGRNAWDYCLALDELLVAGLTVADCRWLADKGLVEACDLIPLRGGKRRGVRRHKASFSRATRFVLTQAGSAYARRLQSANSQTKSREPGSSDGSPGAPRWDSRRRLLRVGSVVVKKLHSSARNQMTILAEFESRGWPRRIDNPLPSVSPSRRAQSLADAVFGLNRNLRAQVIRFHADEKGRSVRYELLR